MKESPPSIKEIRLYNESSGMTLALLSDGRYAVGVMLRAGVVYIRSPADLYCGMDLTKARTAYNDFVEKH